MRRRKPPKQTDNHQRWIVSYADLITLLFAFFVVMYAVSSVNLDKLKKFSQATDQAFKSEIAQTQLQVDPNGEAIDDVEQFADDAITIRQNDRWAELEIKSQALFDTGSADLTVPAKRLLTKLADILKNTKHFISVEGHTDDRAINTTQFPSNWELSAARAASVVRLLTSAGVPTSKIHAVGFGQYYPIASNLSAKGRAENRRVVIVLTKEKTSPRLLQPSLTQETHVVRPQVVKQVTPAVVAEPKQQPAEVVKAKSDEVAVPVVKAIRLKNGGLKFTSGTANVRKGAKAPLIIEEEQRTD